MMNRRIRALAGLALVMMALSLLLAGCGEQKEEKPANPFVGRWTSPEMNKGYDVPYFRVLNGGKPLQGVYEQYDEDGGVVAMKDGEKLSDYFKQRAKEQGSGDMEFLRIIGNAFPGRTYRVQGDELISRVKFSGKDPVEFLAKFVLKDEDTIVLTHLNPDTGDEKVETLTRVP